ncbi:MAG: histidine kinase [Bacteroidales bacterium]|nr:histidine kinase [Bacteroidales bacterium]
MLRRFSQIAFSPLFQALVITVIVILLVPLGLKKYTAEQESMTTNFDKSQLYFADLDHDGTSERIQTFFNLAGNVGIALVAGNVTLGQWNFKGIYQPDCARLMIGDYNGNGSDEIYIFTLVGDSVMMHIMEYSSEPAFIIRDRFITKIGVNLNDPDHAIFPGKVTDMTGDGSGDLVFAINSGFSRQPRNVFIYDVVSDSIKSSPLSGAFIGNIRLSDLDEDGFDEIIVSTYAANNFNDEPFIYSDTSCWMMVLDHDLNFTFPPVEFPGPTGSLELAGIKTGEGKKLIMGKFGLASPSRQFGMFFLSDLDGKIIKEREIGADDQLFTLGLMPSFKGDDGRSIKGTVEHAGIFEIDETLEIRQVSDIKFSRRMPSLIDIDQNGLDEIIILAPGHDKHIILHDDFTSPVSIDFPIQSTVPLFSVKLNGDKPPQLSVQGDQDWKLFNYDINPVYRFRYLVYLAFYIIILGFILIIRKLYSFQLKKKYETEKKIAGLQLSSVKAQMEPHFIMNTINTIGSSIYRQKGEDAYRQLLNFSGMVRSLLVSSDKLTRTLKEETEFVRNYLELERSRFGEMFSFSIRQSEDINPEAIVPKMIIQLHAENALKHGIIPKKTGGVIDIAATKDKDYLVIIIKDNGIGRNAAAKNISQSTGRGMKILSQFFETYNKYNKSQLKQEIIDLYDDDKNPAGTLVKVFVPLDFNDEIY